MSKIKSDDNLFEDDSLSIVPDVDYIFEMFPEMAEWGVPHKDKGDDLILPPAVCENGQHTGNPHCDIVVPDLPSPVPLPAAVWLFATALVALVTVSRRSK